MKCPICKEKMTLAKVEWSGGLTGDQEEHSIFVCEDCLIYTNRILKEIQ